MSASLKEVLAATFLLTTGTSCFRTIVNASMSGRVAIMISFVDDLRVGYHIVLSII